MHNALLYLAAVLIWGSTWLAITYQLGTVAPAVSVAARFALAAALMLLWARAAGQSLRFPLRQHLSLAAQGLTLFCANFILFYSAELYVTSGLVAVICSALVAMNIAGMRLYFGQPVRAHTALGAALGLTGIAVVFWPELAGFRAEGDGLKGTALALAATFSASSGNMLSARHSRQGLPVIAATAVAMSYGAGLTALYAWASGAEFRLDWTPGYLGSLLYLALFGSVAAFGCYLTLIQRIGADKAGYINVVVPLVALLLSSAFEGFDWKAGTVLGLALSLAGNVLILRKPKT